MDVDWIIKNPIHDISIIDNAKVTLLKDKIIILKL